MTPVVYTSVRPVQEHIDRCWLIVRLWEQEIEDEKILPSCPLPDQQARMMDSLAKDAHALRKVLESFQ